MHNQQNQQQDQTAEITTLIEIVQNLHSRVEQLSKNDGYQGWMTIKRAASLIGISSNALHQRITNDHYPENIVWRQKAKGCSVMIHLRELNKIL